MTPLAIALMSMLPMLLANNQGEESNEIEDPELTPKIIKGRNANEGEFPWMMSLHQILDDASERYLCSGFLISLQIAMTAAHCVVLVDGGTPEPASTFYGIIGNRQRNGPETRITFNDVVVHPQYNLTVSPDYDIALLEISETLEMNNLVQPVCISGAGRLFQDRQSGQAMGWGYINEVNQELPEILQTATLPIVNQAYCAFLYRLINVRITDRHICAGLYHRGICYGDSGGPLVIQEITQPLAIGVAAFISGLGCARPLIPGVYTAISAYIDWITTITQDSSNICIV